MIRWECDFCGDISPVYGRGEDFARGAFRAVTTWDRPLVASYAMHFCSDLCELLDRFRGVDVRSLAGSPEAFAARVASQSVGLARARCFKCERCGSVLPLSSECCCTLKKSP